MYDTLIPTFWVWAWDKCTQIFSWASKLTNSSQNVRHSVRGQKMQISMVDVTVYKVCKTFKPS